VWNGLGWPAARSLKTAGAIGLGTNPDIDEPTLAHSDPARARFYVIVVSMVFELS